MLFYTSFWSVVFKILWSRINDFFLPSSIECINRFFFFGETCFCYHFFAVQIKKKLLLFIILEQKNVPLTTWKCNFLCVDKISLFIIHFRWRYLVQMNETKIWRKTKFEWPILRLILFPVISNWANWHL